MTYVSIALGNIKEMLNEISKYEIGASTTRRRGTRKIDRLDNAFWKFVQERIIIMLIANYNAIRILNNPKYYAWKQKARDEGLSVVVTEDGDEAPVRYVRPALRTGTLRERIRNVIIETNTINSKTIGGSPSIQYTLDIENLRNSYGNYFRDLILNRTGKDIFALNERQVEEILELIINRYISGD